MKFRRYLTTIFIALLLTACLCVGGVFAIWEYAGGPTQEMNLNVGIGLNSFLYWEGSETLPGEEGARHIELIDNLVNGKDENGNDVGLNNPQSALSRNVQNRLNGGFLGLFGSKDYYGSMDGTILDNQVDMEGLFNTDTLGLEFIIEVVDDLHYNIYTTDVALGNSGTPNISIGEEVYPVYRTRLERTSTSADFQTVATAVGHAPSRYYEQLTTSGLFHDQRVPSFDIKNWKPLSEYPIGNSPTNAIWTFTGDNPSVALESETGKVYYAIKSAGSRKITSNNSNLEITVRDNNNDVVATSAPVVVDGTYVVSVEFEVPQNTTYYIEVTGSTNVSFTVA